MLLTLTSEQFCVWKNYVKGDCSEVGVGLYSGSRSKRQDKVAPGRFSFSSMIFSFIELVVRHWNRLSREVMDHHPWKCSKPVWIWNLKTWCDGEHGDGAKLT